MKIMGLQKMTLLDYPGKVACTVFFGGCNLRCPYCHNASLVFDSGLPQACSESDFFAFLSARKGLLDGVCITGGEPLLQQGLDSFIAEIRVRGFLVKLDTNGTFPDKLEYLLKHNLLDYVAMDVKNCKRRYAQTVGKTFFDTDAIERSIALLQNSSIPHEFRSTLVRELHTEEDVKELGQWLQGSKALFLQTFVDSKDLVGSVSLSPFSKSEMEHFSNLLQSYIGTVSIRGI